MPVCCGVGVLEARPRARGGFRVRTSEGTVEARNRIAVTGPFQRPLVPPLVPEGSGIAQVHSSAYRAPDGLAPGAVLVVGAGSSGAQIAEEPLLAGRRVLLSVGPHERPPRRYRGRDFFWWLRELGHWDAEPPGPDAEHVTIAVSGARGGHSVDFRTLAARGMALHGRAQGCEHGVMAFAPDLALDVAREDESHLALLDEADAHAAERGLDLPEEPEARVIGGDPACLRDLALSLDLAAAGATSIVRATGDALDLGWLKADAFGPDGRPRHERGVSPVEGH